MRTGTLFPKRPSSYCAAPRSAVVIFVFSRTLKRAHTIGVVARRRFSEHFIFGLIISARFVAQRNAVGRASPAGCLGGGAPAGSVERDAVLERGNHQKETARRGFTRQNPLSQGGLEETSKLFCCGTAYRLALRVFCAFLRIYCSGCCGTNAVRTIFLGDTTQPRVLLPLVALSRLRCVNSEYVFWLFLRSLHPPLFMGGSVLSILSPELSNPAS